MNSISGTSPLPPVSHGSKQAFSYDGYRFYRAVDLYGKKNKQGKASILIFTCSVTHAELWNLWSHKSQRIARFPDETKNNIAVQYGKIPPLVGRNL